MRRVRYRVACSLDGYIAGPSGEYDWIVKDPDVDFEALFDEFDTFLMGRRTYEAAGAAFPGLKIVFSRTLRQADHPGVTIVSDNIKQAVDALRGQPGKDIWLFGGGELFRSLLGAGLVDGVDAGIMPVVLGGGIPLLPAPAGRTRLALRNRRIYEKSGIVGLEYDVVRD